MAYQTPSFPTSEWDGTSPTYPSREIDTLADSSMVDRFISEIIAMQDLLYDSKGPIEFFSTLGPANSIVAVDSASSELKYKTLIAGDNVSITVNDSGIVISATGNGGGTTTFSAEAGEDVSAGQPVYFSMSKLFKAHSDYKEVIGVTTEEILTGATGNYTVDGGVTIADWSAITGSASLTQGSVYYLSGNQLSITPPSTGYLIAVGKAVSSTILEVELQPPIRL